jgi:hypothetical protein
MKGSEILAKYTEAMVISVRAAAAVERAATPEEKAATAANLVTARAAAAAISASLPLLTEQRLYIFYKRIGKAEANIAVLQDELAAAQAVLAGKLEALKDSSWKWAGAAKAKEPTHVTAQREKIEGIEAEIKATRKAIQPDHLFVREMHDSEDFYDEMRLHFAGKGPCPAAYQAKLDEERAIFLRETPPWIPPPGPGPFRDYTPAWMR